MKSLRESLLDDNLIDKSDKIIKDEIKSFLKENFIGASSCKISRKPNIDGKYEVSSTTDIGVKNRNIISLTNGMFIWTKVGGYFNCSHCIRLESLDGTPKIVGGYFDCSGCKSLESLDGAPEKVGGDFECHNCISLTSLEGVPKEVGRDFYCHKCKVKFTEDDVKKISNVKGKIIC